MKKKILLTVMQTIIGLVLMFSIALVVFPLVPPFRGYYHTRAVLTGSMVPSVPRGSLIINKWVKDKDLKTGDIITFQKPTDSVVYITHRIEEVRETVPLYRFGTKGDANDSSDFWEITQTNIEGKVIFVIPYLGYLIEFFKTPIGFILAVVIPLLAFIVKESLQAARIYKNTELGGREGKTKGSGRIGGKIILMVLAAVMLSVPRTGETFALFSSNAVSAGGITLQTAGDFSSVEEGDVVINELMWMGSSVSALDEWVELRNTTGEEIDLSGWQLTNLVSVETLMLTIPSGESIPADGYFLISRLSKDDSAISVAPDLVDSAVVLRNSDLQIKLYKGDWTNSSNLIDTADDGSGTPLAGKNGPRRSMERNGDPTTGWHTCMDSACNDTTYWDSEDDNYGTPKADNLSENDPSEQNSQLEDDPVVGPIEEVQIAKEDIKDEDKAGSVEEAQLQVEDVQEVVVVGENNDGIGQVTEAAVLEDVDKTVTVAEDLEEAEITVGDVKESVIDEKSEPSLVAEEAQPQQVEEAEEKVQEVEVTNNQSETELPAKENDVIE